jgi:hypothetical protein
MQVQRAAIDSQEGHRTCCRSTTSHRVPPIRVSLRNALLAGLDQGKRRDALPVHTSIGTVRGRVEDASTGTVIEEAARMERGREEAECRLLPYRRQPRTASRLFAYLSATPSSQVWIKGNGEMFRGPQSTHKRDIGHAVDHDSLVLDNVLGGLAKVRLVTARSTIDTRKLDPTAIVVFNQA